MSRQRRQQGGQFIAGTKGLPVRARGFDLCAQCFRQPAGILLLDDETLNQLEWRTFVQRAVVAGEGFIQIILFHSGIATGGLCKGFSQHQHDRCGAIQVLRRATIAVQAKRLCGIGQCMQMHMQGIHKCGEVLARTRHIPTHIGQQALLHRTGQ